MTMVIQQYAPLARRTLKELPYSEHIIHMSLGLAGEMGELLDAIKKHAIYGKELDTVNLTEELGDCFWYAANLLPELRVDTAVFAEALAKGAQQAAARRVEIDSVPASKRVFVISADLLQINAAMGLLILQGFLGQQLMTQQPPESGANQSTAIAVGAVESLGGILGSVAGLLDLDCGQAMRLNIEKLAKRYGDRYTGLAALNRDTDAERKVLEGRGEPFGVVAAAVVATHDDTGTIQ